MEKFIKDVFDFHVQLGLPIGDQLPTKLNSERVAWAVKAFNEEAAEFSAAETVEDQVDALVDLFYYACGRVVEIGLPPYEMFSIVHEANLKKKRGNRGRDTEDDAIKPPEYQHPDFRFIREMGPFIEAARLAVSKSDDYNAGSVKREDYFPFGLRSYAHEIFKKGLRLVALADKPDDPNHESIRDTFLDMMNYCNFAIKAIDEGKL